MTIRPRRSVLYVPGSNLRAITKSRSIPADVLVFDLEDSVFPADKVEARALVAETVRAGGFSGREIVIRVNGLKTEWGPTDLAAVARCGADAVLLPKVATPGDIMFASADLYKAAAPDDLALWAMLETPDAVLNASSLARTAADPASRLEALVMGTNDLAKETRIRLKAGRAPMTAWLSICVAAARSAGLDIIDGVFNNLDDAQGLLAECEQGRDFGMDGKSCVHPGQVETCNLVFSPQPDEIAWASKVVAAFEQPDSAQRSVLRIDGMMVERLHASAAARLLLLGKAIEDRGSKLL